MNSINRILVDKKYVEENGQPIYKLYLFDPMDGIVIEYKAPVRRSTILELQEYISSLKTQEELKEEVEQPTVVVEDSTSSIEEEDEE